MSVILNNANVGEKISVSYDGTYDIYLINYGDDNFDLTDLTNEGWTQVQPVELMSTGAHGINTFFLFFKKQKTK